jgi:hypothetical protein
MDAFVRFLEHTLDAKVVSYVNRRTLWIAETRVFFTCHSRFMSFHTSVGV